MALDLTQEAQATPPQRRHALGQAALKALETLAALTQVTQAALALEALVALA